MPHYFDEQQHPCLHVYAVIPRVEGWRLLLSIHRPLMSLMSVCVSRAMPVEWFTNFFCSCPRRPFSPRIVARQSIAQMNRRVRSYPRFKLSFKVAFGASIRETENYFGQKNPSQNIVTKLKTMCLSDSPHLMSTSAANSFHRDSTDRQKRTAVSRTVLPTCLTYLIEPYDICLYSKWTL